MTNGKFNGLKRGELTILSSSKSGKSRTVRLLPNSMRLKQLIREHGFIWVIESGPELKQCFGNAEGFMIRSMNEQHSRNVRTADLEFFNDKG